MAPWNVGRRIIDVSSPGSGIELGPVAPGRTQVLSCALISPAEPPADAPAEDSAWDATTREKLRVELDRHSDFEDAELPHVGPRLYAAYQRQQHVLGADLFKPLDIAE